MKDFHQLLKELEPGKEILTKDGYRAYSNQVQDIVQEGIRLNPLLKYIYIIDGFVRYGASQIPVPPIIGTFVDWKNIAAKVLRALNIPVLDSWPESSDIFLINAYAELKTAVSILESNAKRAKDKTLSDWYEGMRDQLSQLSTVYTEKYKTTAETIDRVLQDATITTLAKMSFKERIQHDKAIKLDFEKKFQDDKVIILGHRKSKELLTEMEIGRVRDTIFMPFYIKITSLKGRKDQYLCFIALIDEVPTDSFSPSYDTIQPLGSPQTIPFYTSTGRTISIAFTIFPEDEDEHKLMVKKLNLLAGLTYPHLNFEEIPITNPTVEITLGQLYQAIPGVITELSIDWGDIWDIDQKFPLYAKVSFSIQVVYDKTPGFNTKFFRLGGQSTIGG